MRVLDTPLVAVAVVALTASPAASAVRYHASPIRTVSRCRGQNAEVEQAVDPARGYVYEDWMGCHGIGFARSTDGGRTFHRSITLPRSAKAPFGSWDPALAVGPDGAVYAAFMTRSRDRAFPVLDVSVDHGATFRGRSALVPRHRFNWGDRDFVAVAPSGTVYVTWDYGPSAADITLFCDPHGSCSFASGDLNAVIQSSTDGGRTFGPMTAISPGFPAGGADSAPLLVEPDGRIDVVYQGYSYRNRRRFTLRTAYMYFTSSTDSGRTWSPRVRLGPHTGTMNQTEWWIDGDLARDLAGNLYVTWDTQGRTAGGRRDDVGWLSYSTDRGATWSAPVQVPRDRANAAHIVEVAGGTGGTAYVGWLSNNTHRGYALYLRTFSIGLGWLGPPVRISRRFGLASVWPGDTFGLSALSATDLVVSWGGATRGRASEIRAARVGVSG
jgi:hypothetical protein